MNLYDTVRNTECIIPEEFDLKIGGAEDLLHSADIRDRYDLVCIAFKFGYMQGQRATKQAGKTNKAGTAGEEEQFRERIIDMISRIRSERRLRRIYNIVNVNFLDDRLEGLNERKD